jgi:hypothetical protein
VRALLARAAAHAGVARGRAPLQLPPDRRRAVWHDLETACRGPREYDLAALVLADRSREPEPAARTALAAYGPYDEELLERSLPVYGAWVAASFMAAVDRRPAAAAALERQMEFLRAFS